MNYSKQTIKFTDLLIRSQAKKDAWSSQYELSFDDICEVDREQLAAFLMLDDIRLASEATSLDNPSYQHMVYALVRFLSDTTNKEAINNFVEQWRLSITSFHDGNIKELIQERLELYNQLKAA